MDPSEKTLSEELKEWKERPVVQRLMVPPPATPNANRWRFELFGGVNHWIELPLRGSGRWLVKQGVLEKTKRLSIPMLMLVKPLAPP